MPAEPQPAATVILIRDADPSPEVLLIERHARSDFLPDMYVFPGGRVEDQDRALAGRLGGFDRRAAANLLPHFDDERTLAFVVAAIRETFEEAGILLARARGDADLLDAERAGALARHRLDVQSGKLAFRDLVEDQDLELAGDCLAAHAHWITPEMVPRRFDTVFFSAIAPPGQRALHDGVETTDHVWIRPEEALRQMEARERQIIFPTAQNLRTLGGFERAEDVLQSSRARAVVPVLPSMAEREGRRVLVIRDDAGYAITEELLPEAAS